MKKVLKSLKKKDEAVAGIIVAVMIVGLIIAVISIIQSMYVPKWMEAREAEHMGVIADQFSQLSFAIDSEAAMKQPVPISTSITLGSKELGFLSSNKAFGRLAIVPNEGSYIIGLDIGSTSTGSFGTLHYSSENAYFINQDYCYEAGALILNQTEGSVFTIEPTFSATVNASRGTVNLSWTCININPTGDKLSISGYGTYPVRTTFLSYTNTSTDISQSVKTLQITTSFPSLWLRYLNSTLSKANLINGTDYTLAKTSGVAAVTFLHDHIFHYYLNLKIITISTQLAPGWIES
jgi:hypothetical protein